MAWPHPKPINSEFGGRSPGINMFSVSRCFQQGEMARMRTTDTGGKHSVSESAVKKKTFFVNH